MTEAVKTDLSKKEFDALRETHISLNFRGLMKGWKKIFHDAPFSVFKSVVK